MIKEELRRKYKEKRELISHSQNDELSSRIFQNLVTNFELEHKNISCFVPIERFNEINTWHILDGVKSHFYLPVLADEYELKHIRYEGKEKLKKNSWGILEPVSGQQIRAQELDFVLVPLLTIDKQGCRVGYGKGYYDKFLSHCKPSCKFIGLYHFDQVEIIDDIHSNDVALHYCVTPNNVLKFPL